MYSIVSSSSREVAGVCHTSRDDSALCQYMLEGGEAVSDPGRQCNTVYRQSFSDDADDWDTTLTTSTDAGLTLMESVINNPHRSSLMSQVWYKNRRYKKAIYRFRIEGRLQNLNYKNRIEKVL